MGYINRAIWGGELLDIGSGYGFFVDAISKLGYQAYGIDVSRDRLYLAKEYMSGNFILGEVNRLFAESNRDRFMIVTLFHVLEHLRSPVEFLKQCEQIISSKGFLLIEVPSLDDELINQQVDYRSFYWQRAHISYFDRSKLELTLLRAGFKSYTIQGIQRYGLRNLMHWLDVHEPELVPAKHQALEPIYTRLEDMYRNDRVKSLTCDTLIAQVNK